MSLAVDASIVFRLLADVKGDDAFGVVPGRRPEHQVEGARGRRDGERRVEGVGMRGVERFIWVQPARRGQAGA